MTGQKQNKPDSRSQQARDIAASHHGRVSSSNFQFLSLATWSIAASGKKKLNLDTVAGENDRDENYCRHVLLPEQWASGMKPAPPRIVYGKASAKSVAKSAADLVREQDRHPVTRAAVTIVFSVPQDFDDSWDCESAGPRWAAFCADTIAWLRRRFDDEQGVRLRTVLRHLDEPCQHAHAWLVPLKGETIAAAHPGHAAALAAAGRGANRYAQGGAYRKAMTAFLDDFHREVGEPHGLIRSFLDVPGARRAHVFKDSRDARAHRQALKELRAIKDAELEAMAKRLRALRKRVVELEQLNAMLHADAKAASRMAFSEHFDRSAPSVPAVTPKTTIGTSDPKVRIAMSDDEVQAMFAAEEARKRNGKVIRVEVPAPTQSDDHCDRLRPSRRPLPGRGPAFPA